MINELLKITTYFWLFNLFYKKINDIFRLNLFDKVEHELSTRVYSSLHAIISATSALLYLVNNDYFYFIWNESTFITISYTIFDIYITTKYKNVIYQNENLSYLSNIIHHTSLTALILMDKYTNEIFMKLLAMGLLAEFSTVFLNISWAMHKYKKIQFSFNTKRKYTFITLVSYFCLRIINLTYVVLTNQDLQTYKLIYYSTGSIILLNYYWFYCLAVIFKKKYMISY